VTLGLVHGSQPDALVLCHDPRRRSLEGYPEQIIPDLADVAERYLQAARVTNRSVELVGVSLNTLGMDPIEMETALAGAADELGVPAFDPMRSDLAPLVDRLSTRVNAVAA
jgi:uncharacterized NAD-dependent epimerase/dehydratase family protein